MSSSEFWSLLGEIEHEQLDFKHGAPDLTTIIPAMAMTNGGLVVLGVDDDRKITGCPLSQNVLDRVKKHSNEVDVAIQLKEVRVGRWALTLVAIPQVDGRIVTTPDGRLVRRVGSDSQPLVGDALARFVREREQRAADDQILPQMDIDDFDLAPINKALAADGRPSVRRAGILRALVDLGVADPEPSPADPGVSAAAVLLFAREPEKYIQGATVQVVRRVGVGPGPGPARQRAELRGASEAILEDTLNFIANNTQSYQVIAGTHREVLPEYPVAVLREAVLNALAHRDYWLTGTTIDITIWDDRIEIQSPGGLPGHITLENIREEHFSRNRRIMRILKLLGLVEEYGEGVDRMYGEMEARLMEPPVFAPTPSSVTVTLRNRFLVSVEDQVWLSLLAHFDLTPQERRLLVFARREDGISPRRARSLMPDVEIEQLLTGTVAKGLLVRTGHGGGVRYVLSDEVVVRAGGAGLEARSRKRQMLLDELRRRGSLSTADGAKLLGEDQAFVRHLLNDFTRAGLALARGRTRARRYYPAT
jgi:ATP-dependent DNA helicase RecG